MATPHEDGHGRGARRRMSLWGQGDQKPPMGGAKEPNKRVSFFGGGDSRSSRRPSVPDDDDDDDSGESFKAGDALAKTLDRDAWHTKTLEFLARGGARVDTGKQPGLSVRSYLEQQALRKTLLTTSKAGWEVRTMSFLLSGKAWVGNGTAEGVRVQAWLEKHDPDLLAAAKEFQAAEAAKQLPNLPDAPPEGDQADVGKAKTGGGTQWSKLSVASRISRRISRERRMSGETLEAEEEAPGGAPGSFRPRSLRASREVAVAPSPPS